MTDYFKGVVDPSTLYFGKPDPEIFNRAGDILGLAPHEIIGLEDAIAGVQAIKGAGQTPLGVGAAVADEALPLWFADTSQISLANIESKLSIKRLIVVSYSNLKTAYHKSGFFVF